ncbi:MAG: hypothetical protein ACI308_09470 [Muribaculaceae bacterium]
MQNTLNISTAKLAAVAQQAISFMKRHRKTVVAVLLIAAAILLIVNSCHAQGLTLAFALVATGEGGEMVTGGPVTTDLVHQSANDYLLNEIDRQITKIRPMATPIDQLSRLAGAKRSGSMVVDYYNVDTKPTKCTLKTGIQISEDTDFNESHAHRYINTSNNAIFDVSDTILVKGTKGYKPDGSQSSQDLVLYVLGKSDTQGLLVTAVNGITSGDITGIVPSITAGAELVRMGRAATELDVQTPQFEALPQRASQNCQIFKAQVEQSVLHRMANKEADWTLNDQGEAAIYDMRLGMEKSFLFGVKQIIYDPQKRENVYLTGGIWHQAGKEFAYNANSLTEETLVDMMREAFTGNAGSKRKVLIGGSALIGRLNKLTYSKVVNAGENVVKWGIDFSEMRSKFGTLYVLLSEVFDECGMQDCGMIIDPEYLQKYSHLPFGTEALNLKASGQRNTDAIVLTEASCLVLRYPKAHMRIVMD